MPISEVEEYEKAHGFGSGGDRDPEKARMLIWVDDAEQPFLCEGDNKVCNGENDEAPAEGFTGLQADHQRGGEEQDALVLNSVADKSQPGVNGDADNGAAVGLAGV